MAFLLKQEKKPYVFFAFNYVFVVCAGMHTYMQASISQHKCGGQSQFSAAVPSQGLGAGRQVWQQVPAEHLTGLVKLQLLFPSHSLSSFWMLDASPVHVNWWLCGALGKDGSCAMLVTTLPPRLDCWPKSLHLDQPLCTVGFLGCFCSHWDTVVLRFSLRSTSRIPVVEMLENYSKSW